MPDHFERVDRLVRTLHSGAEYTEALHTELPSVSRGLVHLHLHERLLHMLDVRRGKLDHPLAVAQVGTERTTCSRGRKQIRSSNARRSSS